MVTPGAPTRWSRAAALAWVTAMGRGAPVTGAQHNAIVATLAAARDALADPDRPRATPDAPGAVVGGVDMRRDASPADLALWDATGQLIADLARAEPCFSLLDDADAVGVLVYVDGAAALALRPDAAALQEAPAVMRDGPAIVRAAIEGAMTPHAVATAVQRVDGERRSRVLDLAADALSAAGRWLAVPRNRAKALEVVGALAVGGTAAAGAAARGKRHRRRRST